ncbi:carbohydrate ABC transporter permease [Paenibacillus xylanilyticus]|uniref:Carbohydrate ABC transporter permease n=1 Tax=Paenibacillus xylanilyticus TaxID=248903 RepID=A0A7Y6BXG1_9BACL|nr:carbohydrate ABC transporter permease [Paenibacillus xylanilyticus]NUU76782.1 carbohydrate ABC transporter permease [Paenibacillus xylanilyticus]
MKARFSWFDMVLAIMIILISLTVILPFLYIIAVSFSLPGDSMAGNFFIWPKNWTLDAYQYLLGAKSFLNSLKNSVIITALGTCISLIVSIMLAYTLSKKGIPGSRIILLLIFFTMIFHGGMIPTYLVVKNLHLIDTYGAIVLPAATSAFNILVIRTFFQSLPPSLDEAARMDGAGEFRILFSIVIPLSKPIIATFTLFFVVQYWNDFFSSVIYLNDTNRWPIQPLLRQMVTISASNISSEAALDAQLAANLGPNVQNAAILLAMLPIVVVYPFLQKHFAKGAMLGSIKE